MLLGLILQRFLLTDEELRDKTLMPHISRPNPSNIRWGYMYLYLLEQVEKFAIKKWGSLEQIEEERLHRSGKLQERKEKKFSAKLKGKLNDSVTQEIELRSKTRVKDRINSTKHKHNYI